MSKIATEQDVYNVGKQGTPVANKCCTKERVSDLGCILTQSRNSNQLVIEGTYSKLYQIHLYHSNAFQYSLYSGTNASYSQVSSSGTLTITSNSDKSSITLLCTNKSYNNTRIQISGDASFSGIVNETNCSASISGNYLYISNISSSSTSSARCGVNIMLSMGLTRTLYFNF